MLLSPVAEDGLEGQDQRPTESARLVGGGGQLYERAWSPQPPQTVRGRPRPRSSSRRVGARRLGESVPVVAHPSTRSLAHGWAGGAGHRGMGGLVEPTQAQQCRREPSSFRVWAALSWPTRSHRCRV